MGGSKNVFIKSAVILVVLGVLAVNGHENDDLVFDQDGKNPGIEVPLIQRQKHSSFFQRIKRGVWDWFSAPTTSTESPKTENETTTATVEKEPVATPNRTKTKDILDLFGDDSKDRKPRASDEENIIEHENSSPKNDNDNDIGEFAAGHTDDEDLAGSGEVEGSAVDGDGWVTESPRVGGQARFYRITLTVLEPFREEYRDRNSEEHKELAGSLVKGIEDLYRQKIPDYEHFANVVKIARLEDAFTSEVTLDIGSTFGDEAEVRNILERQLLFHTLGGIPVDSKGFTFRNFQGPGVEGECDENTELRCRDGSCAPLNSRCDNEYDCADGSDEFDCPQYTLVGENHPEESEEVTPRPVDSPTVGNNSGRTECRGDDYAVACTDGSRHICTLQKCDGVQDCDDGADEEGCSSSGCASGEFVCDVTRCILDSQRCDFSVDCEDGSDEQSCTYPICTQSEFKCRNSQCLEASLRCNGINDCRDGSDEINCPCKDDQFECTPLYCISAELRCDGIHHCSNGQDEKDCEQTNPRCRQDEFECDNGNCINSRLRCDGRSDCSDRSDERNCTVTTCTSDEFRCQDGTCLGIEKRCNGHHDCRNGEDETQCGCGTSEFICEDGQCIPYKLQCNGVNDCRDGSDERDCENVIRQDFDNINPLDRRIGIITTEGTKKKERFYNPDRSARIKEDPAKISSISTGFEIPSAGDFGDPNIAAYPEFGLMVEKLFNTHETNDASTLNKDWEYIEFKDPGNRQKLTKSKTVARNAERDIEATLFNGIVTIGTDYYEGLDYDEDTTSSATEKTEMRTISGLYKNDLVDGASAAASSPKFLLSDRATVTAESSDSSGLIDETFDSGKLKNLRKTERNTKSDRVYDANATFLHSNFNSSKNVSDGIIKPSTKSPISLNTDDSKEETNSSQRVSQSIDVHETGQSNGNSSNELSDNTRRVTVGFSNATTERALIRYFKKYNVTRRIPESTEPPLGSHNRSASLKLSMNSSTPTSEMEDGGKLNRSSKVLGIPQSMDIFDENLPSKNFLEQENASTVATTRGPSFETSRNPARAKKLKNFYFYMDKYNVTKSRKLGTPDDIETPAATKASSVEHIGAANNGTDQLGKKKESLKLKDTKDPKHRENRGKTRVSKDGRRRKNNKKKSDPYKNVKVETELFEKNHVELPKRLRLNVTEKIRGEDKKAAPVIISRGNDNDDTDDCSRVCFKCLLKFNAKKATTPKSSILTEPIFDVKSIENVDSGLTETSDNEMITNSNVQTNSIDSNEAEWIEISTTTKKTRQRKKSRKATRTRFPTTTEAMKIHGQESTTNELPTKSTATPKNSAASRRKRVRNGKRNRRRKTSKKVTTNTPLEGQSTMGISEPSPGLSTLISIDLSDFPSTNNVRTTEPRISTDSSTPLSTDDPEAHNATSRTNKFEIIASASQPPAPETTCGPVDLVCQVQKFVRDSIMEVATSTSQSPSTEATPGTRDAKTHSESTSAVPESVQPSSTQRSKDCDDFFGDCWDRGSSETQSSQTVSEEPERAAPLVATPAKNCDSFACWLEKLPGFRESFNLRGTSTEPSRSVSSAERAEDHELESNESSAWERLEKFPSPETAKAKPDKLSTSLNENFSTEMDVSEEIVPTDARPSKLLSTVAEKSTQSSRFPWDPWFSEVTSDGDSKIGEKKTFTKLYDSTASGPPARALQKSTIYPCPDDQYRCDRDRCIELDRVCNGIIDCYDRTDETICPSGQNRPDYIGHGSRDRCRIDQHPCDETKCLEIENTCDGIPHCEDGSDETDCEDYINRRNEVLNDYRNRYRLRKTAMTSVGPHENPRRPTRRRPCLEEFEYRCNNGECIAEVRQCDGVIDCVDGDDEDPVLCGESPYCPDGQLPCANGVCISRRFFCDRNTDCLDGSDEKNCPDIIPDPYPPPCQSDQFTCNDGSCIPVTSRCNGRADCPNDEDEHECRRGCARDQFQCRNGDCINTHQKCDGFVNCDDGSDEEGCEADTTPANRYCTSQQFTCVSDRTCVHYSSRCNGIPDCRDRSDEEGCETDLETEGLLLKTYPSEQIIKESREVVFQCRDEGQLRAHVRWLRGNGLPLPPGSRDLNGRLEIPNVQLDHSGLYICEAVGYSSSTPGQQVSVHLEVEKFDPPSTRPPQVCKYDEATCSNGMCILKSFVCDGKFDCADGSDEMRCSPHGCEPNQFRCANKQCVSKIWRCDGDKDCADGSDEENCAPPPPGSPCRYDEYACSSYDQCIPKSYHCDMERDCQDGSDEIGCSPVYITKPPPAMVNLQPGESLILTCTAIGVPIPEINWRLNWGHVPSKCSSTSVNGTGTLNCPDMQVSDQGAYSCEALNVGGFVFAVPDAIVVMDEKPDICPPGKFNSEARTPEECISCFCFGVADKCKSANLFTYQLPPPFDRYKVVTVETGPELRINGEINYQVAEVKPRGSSGAEISAPYNTELTSYNVPYFELPDSYYGPSQLKSYGGYLKYKISYSGDGSPNYAPDVIISGNGYTLLHRGQPVQPDITTERSVRFFYGEWLKNERGQEIPASREEIMMVLLKVEHILIKAKYEDSPELQVTITDITMDTADKGNNGLVASYVEECTCPTGYSGESCQNCANGYLRRKSGSWLGECYRDVPPCPPGYYGDPLRNIPCTACPCPLTNPANQFGRTCRLGADRNPICDCPPGYIGHRCEQCAAGYHGNPLIPGDMCVPDELCDPHGSINPTADADGKCHCKLFVTGLKCDQCKANTFNLASKNQFGCISCFCMGNTDKCTSSNWYRNEIRVSFTNSIRDFTLVESNAPNAQRIVQGIRLDTISREIVYSAFPNRGNTDVYYWQLPAIFLGNQIASYGGDLRYTLRYIPSPGGQSSRNNAADVELISENHINLLYFSRETHEANLAQSFTVPLLEQYWQRADGTQADREHLLMALADVREIRIKATYTTHTEEAALSFVSLETAEKQNNGNERAVEVEECNCPIGYRGLSCEDCAVGYTRVARGIYLGFCEPCSCNGNSNQCDPETGICEYCGNHTTGDNCELCEPGYEGDPTRGGCTRKDNNPGHCQCNSAGSRSERCIDGRCECKANVEGAECNRCRPSTFGLAAENLNGCNECYCSGVTNQCHESSLYIQQIPMVVYDSRHGFTLTDPTRKDVIDDEFELNLASNEIGYRYSHNRNRRLFWSLPPAFTGNKVKSYGGSLTLTQHITALPNSQILKDQDVLLEGNGIRLFWTNPQEIVPGIPLTYTVVLRESEWRRLSTEGPRRASRNDLMTVLSNLEAILVRASHSEGMTATYISDISLDTAVEIVSGRRATQIEACRCPPGYSGTSCETCARGYYRDINDRSVSILGSCVLCPCNDHEESCELSRSDQVKCHCLLGYTGQYCQDIVDYPPTPRPVPTPTIIPPRIIVSIQEKKFQIVHTGSTVRYHCNGRSVDNSPLNIRWIKEGSPLPELSVDDARGLLVLRNVRVSDSGVYVCQVSDGVSLAVEKVTLTVGGSNPVAPRVVIHPQYNRVVEGGSLQFTCEATGNPQPEVEWVRVKGRMNPQSTFQNGVWQLSTVTMEDAGEYKCIARNEVGDREHSAMVYVLDAPRPNPDFDLRPTITPTYWIGNAGDPVKLICTKTPNHVRVSWARFGSLPLPISASERNGVLSIANPIENDSGRYICIATSLQGIEYSSYVNVTIHSRTQPNVRVDPDRQTVSQGTSAEVRCIADRDSGLQIKWIKYGETSLGPNARQIGDSLVLTKPQVADRGVYICRASNAAGSYEASTIIEVEPREVPILEIYPKTSQVVNLGGSSDLQCRVAAGFPIPEVHWSRDDGRHFGSNIEQLPGGVLRLINITLADGGAYKCSASNIVGSTSAIARIEVQAMPTITILPAGGLIYAKPNSRVRLTCTAQGIPPPNVAWLKSTPGVSVYNFAARGSDSSHLSAVHEIMSMSSKDEGSYTCQAVNAAGITEKRVQIRLEEDNSVPEPCRGDVPCDDEDGHSGSVGDNKPGVRIPEDYLRIPNGGRVEFRCNVFVPDGSQIYLDWKRSDRRPLPEGSTVHSGVLTIPKVTKDAVGEYVCSGLNHLGVELFRAKAHLDVVSLPSIQLNPNRQTVGPGESPAIVCTATGDQPMTLEWEAIGRPLPSSVTHDRGVLQFHGIHYTDAGKYVCKATNNAGTADAVAEVLVSENTIEDSDIRAVERDITTSAGNSVRLRCLVQQRSTIHWTKDGHPLSRNIRVGDDYIELVAVQPEDSGKYVCQTRNPHGVSSDYINLRVDGSISPVVSIEPSLDIVNIGDMIDLRCTYTGTQNPRYRWSRPNHPSLPVNALEHGNVLRISNIELTETGVYRCHADTAEGTYEQDFNLIVQGGTNDAPAIETKYVPYGSSLEIGCRKDLEHPLKFQWSKLGGMLPPDAQMFGDKLKLVDVKSEDAGTYICTATNGVENSEVPTVLVVTGVVPNFNQAPQSWISLPPLPDSYLKFNIEVSFKPERDDGIILYNDEKADGTGDFISLSLVRGYPEFKFDLGSGVSVIRADQPLSLSEWHTIKLQRTRKEGTMIVDGEGIYKAVNPGRKQGLDLKEPLYIGGVPDYSSINSKVEMNAGFVGCISKLVLGEKNVDLIGDQSDSVGVTTCETCAENPCNNAGVCQEASTKNGYKCLCRAGYSGKHCDSTGESCYPGACGDGSCVDTESGFECYCGHGRSGPRCEYMTVHMKEPSIRNNRAYMSYPTPSAARRLIPRNAIKAKRSHARSSHTPQLRKGRSRSARLKHHNVHSTKH